MDYSALKFPKGVTRKQLKGRLDRVEAALKAKVRALVAERDGDCRMEHAGLGVCGGASEWCHLEESKRARTRGMPPDVRHTTAGSITACTTHHRRYDAGEIRIEYLSAKGADGRLAFHCGLRAFTEPVKRKERG